MTKTSELNCWGRFGPLRNTACLGFHGIQKFNIRFQKSRYQTILFIVAGVVPPEVFDLCLYYVSFTEKSTFVYLYFAFRLGFGLQGLLHNIQLKIFLKAFRQIYIHTKVIPYPPQIPSAPCQQAITRNFSIWPTNLPGHWYR